MNASIVKRVDRGLWRRIRPWIVVYVGAIGVIGVVAGIVWNRVVTLPSYQIGDDYRARIPESGLSQIVATDVYFSIVGAVAGLLLGVMGWIIFRRVGWPVALITAAGAAIAGVITRYVGEFIGPRGFQERIAIATTGDWVRVDFTAHTWVPLAIWIGMAALPVLIAALISRPEWISHVVDTTGSTPTLPDMEKPSV